MNSCCEPPTFEYEAFAFCGYSVTCTPLRSISRAILMVFVSALCAQDAFVERDRPNSRANVQVTLQLVAAVIDSISSLSSKLVSLPQQCDAVNELVVRISEIYPKLHLSPNIHSVATQPVPLQDAVPVPVLSYIAKAVAALVGDGLHLSPGRNPPSSILSLLAYACASPSPQVNTKP